MAGVLHIDLQDPRVQRMLGGSPLASGKPREVVQIAGDVPDPTGLSGYRGAQSTTRLNTGKQEVLVLYGDLIMTLDVYQVPSEPTLVHLFCPRCHKLSTIRGDQKAIDFDGAAQNPLLGEIAGMGKLRPELVAVMATGRLSIETFECAWEEGDGPHVPGLVTGGSTLCRLRIAIEDNRAKDA